MQKKETETTPFFTEHSPRINTTPAIKYGQFVAWCTQHNLSQADILYLSTTMTSGGFKRVANLTEPGWLSTVVARNNEISSAFRRILLEQGLIAPNSVVVFAPDIGPCQFDARTRWEESDYLFFWFLILSGIPPEFAYQIQEEMQQTYTADHLMNNHQLAHDERAPGYEQFIDHFLSLTQRSRQGITPARGMIRLLDPESSLGSRAERTLARQLGIPISTAHIDNLGHVYFNSIRDKLQILIDAGVSLQLLTNAATQNAMALVDETDIL